MPPAGQYFEIENKIIRQVEWGRIKLREKTNGY